MARSLRSALGLVSMLRALRSPVQLPCARPPGDGAGIAMPMAGYRPMVYARRAPFHFMGYSRRARRSSYRTVPDAISPDATDRRTVVAPGSPQSSHVSALGTWQCHPCLRQQRQSTSSILPPCSISSPRRSRAHSAGRTRASVNTTGVAQVSVHPKWDADLDYTKISRFT